VCVNVRRIFAGIAQLVEQLICNQQVVGSNPTAGSIVNRSFPELLTVVLGHPCDSETVFLTRKSRSNNRVAPVAFIRRETRYMSVLILRP
jgi:hypothetical protein